MGTSWSIILFIGQQGVICLHMYVCVVNVVLKLALVNNAEHEELLGPVDAVAGVLERPHDPVEEGSTSGVSTINSTKSAKLLHDLHHSKHCHLLQDNLQATRVENRRSASDVLFFLAIHLLLCSCLAVYKGHRTATKGKLCFP